MPTVRKSVIVAPARARTLFALVDDVERYPAVPAVVRGTEVLERTETTTRRAHRHRLPRPEEPHRDASTARSRPSGCTSSSATARSSASTATGASCPWARTAAASSSRSTTRFESRALEALLGPVFGHIAETLVDRFVARAEAVEAAMKVSVARRAGRAPGGRSSIELARRGSTVADARRGGAGRRSAFPSSACGGAARGHLVAALRAGNGAARRRSRRALPRAAGRTRSRCAARARASRPRPGRPSPRSRSGP